MQTLDEQWMLLAIAAAQQAQLLGEVPIGCVVVHQPTGRILGTGHNRRETDRDPTAHAEIIALRAAGQALGLWRLVDCCVVVTLEPCPMCAGAIVAARADRLIYGCDDPKAGAVKTLYQLCHDPRLNHRLTVTPGILAEPCANLLTNFFKSQRLAGKK